MIPSAQDSGWVRIAEEIKVQMKVQSRRRLGASKHTQVRGCINYYGHNADLQGRKKGTGDSIQARVTQRPPQGI